MKRTKIGKTGLKRVTKRYPPPVEGQLLLSVDQTAALLGIGRVSVYRLLREKRLDSVVLLDRTRRIPRASTDKLISELTNQTT